jgi:hypothetical protein
VTCRVVLCLCLPPNVLCVRIVPIGQSLSAEVACRAFHSVLHGATGAIWYVVVSDFCYGGGSVFDCSEVPLLVC